MRTSRKHSLLIWAVILGGGALVVAHHFCRSARSAGREVARPGPEGGPGVARFGEVEVDFPGRCVAFPARVARADGRVRFLLCLKGYRWLEPECAIVSGARLADLQVALAALDWRLWNRLWTGEGARGPDSVGGLHITLNWGGKSLDARRLIRGGEDMVPPQIVFFGLPQFDSIVLQSDLQEDCSKCPLLPVEKAHLEALLAGEESGQDCELDAAVFPPAGTEVVVRMYEDSH